MKDVMLSKRQAELGAKMRKDFPYKDAEQSELDRLRAVNKELAELLTQACECAVTQAEWDKPPYSKWYYKATAALAKAGQA